MTNSNQSLAEIEQNDFVNFEEIERKLEKDINAGLKDLSFLEEEREKIGNPNSLGSVVKDVIWDQFINQIGQYAGEEFIKENRGLTLDLHDSAHIQTAENFAEGKLAEHNYISKEQLEQNYDRFKNLPHKEFRKKYVNPKMNSTLKRAGELNRNGVETVTDIYNGRQIPTAQKLPNGKNNPEAAQREHVGASASFYLHPALQMGYSNEELAAIINDPENLQGYTTAERNNRKSDNSPNEMNSKDANKHWEKANERSQKHKDKYIQKAKDRLETEGQKTKKEEVVKAKKMAIKAIIMSMLAELVKKIIQKFIKWLQSAEKSVKTLAKYVKDAILDFVKNLKSTFFSAGNSIVAAISTAIVGPVVTLIKKAMIFLKQGWKSLKDAVAFLKDPNNKALPFGIRVLEVGKIVVAGFTGASAIILGEAFEVGLKSIPGAGVFFSFEIPLLGSIANILGIFFGAVVAGIIGAIALNLIDKLIAKHQLNENQRAQIEKRNEILSSQKRLIETVSNDTSATAVEVAESIGHRHQQAANYVDAVLAQIDSNTMQVEIDEQVSDDYAEPEVLFSSSTEEDEHNDILTNLITMSNKM